MERKREGTRDRKGKERKRKVRKVEDFMKVEVDPKERERDSRRKKAKILINI